MGKARAGTEANAERRFGVRVTYHALEQVRERLNLLGSASRFSSEPDMSLSLRIAEACDREHRDRFTYEGTMHEVVDLSDALEADLHAFIRVNRVLSVLTGDQIARSKNSGNWKAT